MTGKDLSLHPPLPPVCARISNPTTRPHTCPPSPKYQWLANKYIYAAMVHQMQNIKYSEKFRKKKCFKVSLEKAQMRPCWWKGKMEFYNKALWPVSQCGNHARVKHRAFKRNNKLTKKNIESYLHNYICVPKCLLPSPLFCEWHVSVETTKEFVCLAGSMRHTSINTLKDKYLSLGKNAWQDIIYRKMYFKQMAQQTQLDVKMEIEFLKSYQ